MSLGEDEPRKYTYLQTHFIKYNSGDKIKNTEMGKERSTYGESRSAYRVLVGKPEVRKPLGTRRSKWEDNIKVDLREMEWGRA